MRVESPAAAYPHSSLDATQRLTLANLKHTSFHQVIQEISLFDGGSTFTPKISQFSLVLIQKYRLHTKFLKFPVCHLYLDYL